MTRRMGHCIGLKAEKIAEYKELHAAVWPEILARISACNIRNYSIFLREPENLLFAYWEYTGTDFATDMAAMAADPPRSAGGRSACPAKARCRQGPRANGGPAWRRCFTSTEAEPPFRTLDRLLFSLIDEIIIHIRT